MACNTEDGHTVGIRDEEFEALIEQLDRVGRSSYRKWGPGRLGGRIPKDDLPVFGPEVHQCGARAPSYPVEFLRPFYRFQVGIDGSAPADSVWVGCGGEAPSEHPVEVAETGEAYFDGDTGDGGA